MVRLNPSVHRSRERPKNHVSSEYHGWEALDENGIIPVGTTVDHGTVLVGAKFRLMNGDRRLDHDASFVYKTKNLGQTSTSIVHSITVVSKPGKGEVITVILRKSMCVQAGSKLCAPFGQKFTIREIMNGEDMPFPMDDRFPIPDIIMEPEAVIGRNTVGMPIAAALGNIAAATGRSFNTTAHHPLETDTDPATGRPKTVIQFLKDEFRKLGIRETGCVDMIDGRTGEQIEAPMFMGMMDICILPKHHPHKAFVRPPVGANSAVFNTPSRGAAHHGGVQRGEMERDAHDMHGAAMTEKEATIKRGGSVRIPVCENCGQIASFGSDIVEKIHNSSSGNDVVTHCGCNAKVRFVNLRFVTNAMIEMLAAVNIRCAIETKER